MSLMRAPQIREMRVALVEIASYPTVYSVIVHSAYSDGQVASQAAVRAALTVQQSDGAASSRRSGADSSVQLLENSHDTSGQVQQNDIDQIGRAMVEATSRSQNVWRNAGRPGDDSEMVRQVGQLACQPASQPASHWASHWARLSEPEPEPESQKTRTIHPSVPADFLSCLSFYPAGGTGTCTTRVCRRGGECSPACVTPGACRYSWCIDRS